MHLKNRFVGLFLQHVNGSGELVSDQFFYCLCPLGEYKIKINAVLASLPAPKGIKPIIHF